MHELYVSTLIINRANFVLPSQHKQAAGTPSGNTSHSSDILCWSYRWQYEGCEIVVHKL